MIMLKNLTATCFMITVLFVTALMTAGCGGPGSDAGENPGYSSYILLATTTSTYDSGLLDYVIPVFTADTGIEVRVLSRGTGQALELGQRGDADVLLVHDRASELKLVDEGYFTDRHDVMYNDFIILGPPADPAAISGMDSAVEALAAIARGGYPFISRGDDSGTHRLEQRLWAQAGIIPEGSLYYSVGQGMGDTLRVANEKEAYTISDRGTYLSLKKSLDLVVVLEGDPPLLNQYGVMAVNPDRHPHVKHQSALQFIEFMTSEKGLELIASFTIEGEPLFFPGLAVPE
jgi:tungstate transport system substrate-binding protein